MFSAEVIETKTAFKSNQKDEKGRILPLGSILVRFNSNSIAGQVKNFYARPFSFNKRVPFIGEQVFVVQAPVHDATAADKVSTGYLYLVPYNSTDDVAINQFPKLWERSNHHSKEVPTIKADKKEIGYSFVKNEDIKYVEYLQPFEGDTLYEGRMGQSIRIGSTIVKGLGTYDKAPTWKGSKHGSPIIIIRIRNPKQTKKRNIDISSSTNPAANKYDIESLKDDDSSIYICSDQKLDQLQLGFKKNSTVKGIPTWNNSSQLVFDSSRIVLNAKKDGLYLVGNKEAILTANKVILHTSKHYVDVDELMEYIKSIVKEMNDLATATKFYTTSMGPTGPATNAVNITKLYTATFTKTFKK